MNPSTTRVARWLAASILFGATVLVHTGTAQATNYYLEVTAFTTTSGCVYDSANHPLIGIGQVANAALNATPIVNVSPDTASSTAYAWAGTTEPNGLYASIGYFDSTGAFVDEFQGYSGLLSSGTFSGSEVTKATPTPPYTSAGVQCSATTKVQVEATGYNTFP